MKAERWFFLLPGEFPAIDMRFERLVTQREARQGIRAWLGVARLPRGTAVWPAT